MVQLVVAIVLAGAPCRDKVTEVVVVTAEHRLWLCERGEAKADYRVALGSGGIDKRKEGDAKTPLGTYGLALGRASASFHTFIYVAYPTQEQAAQGFTGGAIGVHGPARGFANAGEVNVMTDWTLGCIAVASDAIIDSIAAWVKNVGCETIRIRE